MVEKPDGRVKNKNISWHCHKCGRRLAEVSLAPGDCSLVEIVCPRCRDRNVFDCTWYNRVRNPVETCSRCPRQS